MSAALGWPALAQPANDPILCAPTEFSPEAQQRYAAHAQALACCLRGLYGGHPGFDDWLRGFVASLACLEQQRGEDLRTLDRQRALAPDWLARSSGVAYSCYVDRFATDLRALQGRIPYLRELGVGLLHLLPFLRMRDGANDGGFAVSDFAQVQPELGSVADLVALGAALRRDGISLMADIVLNHVADDHPWARAAAGGDAGKQGYFLTFTDPEELAALQSGLDEVFPEQAPGSFTWSQELGRWVWATFYGYQWDLDYRNPLVFGEMALAMVHLANLGVEVLRVDSAPYIWKRKGSDCRNQPEVHMILRAMRLVLDVVAPATALNAEAIVDCVDILGYFGSTPDAPECALAYHSGLMTSTWASLALGNARLLRQVVLATPALPAACSWLNYVRCHDDIVWSVLRSTTEALGQDFAELIGATVRVMHGQVEGGWSRGIASQRHRPLHGTSGMTADLVGLRAGDQASLDRYALLYGVMFALPGIPLIYMGDELGQGNALLPMDDPAADTRWLHRPVLDAVACAQRHVEGTLAQRVFGLLQWLGAARRAVLPSDAGIGLQQGLPEAVLGLRRGGSLVLLNFSPVGQQLVLPSGVWRLHQPWEPQPKRISDDLQLRGYGQAWLQPDEASGCSCTLSLVEPP